jgi:hypothetical protein
MPAPPSARPPSPTWWPVTDAPATRTAQVATATADPVVPELDAIIVGKPIHAFEPRPSTAVPYRADTVVDGWSTEQIVVRAASTRGYGHRWDRRPRQDDLAVGVHEPTGVVFIVVADGVSASPLSHLGATAACRHTLETARTQLDGQGRLDWQELAAGAAWSLVHLAQSGAAAPAGNGGQRTRAVAGSPGAPDSDNDAVALASAAFACTLIAAAVWPTSTGLEVECIAVGDSSVWTVAGGEWNRRVGKEGTENGLASNRTAALPHLPATIAPLRFSLDPDSALVVGTDGFGDALGSGQGAVGRVFASLLRVPPTPMRLALALDFSLETFDDDRTVVAVWPRVKTDPAAHTPTPQPASADRGQPGRPA